MAQLFHVGQAQQCGFALDRVHQAEHLAHDVHVLVLFPVQDQGFEVLHDAVLAGQEIGEDFLVDERGQRSRRDRIRRGPQDPDFLGVPAVGENVLQGRNDIPQMREQGGPIGRIRLQPGLAGFERGLGRRRFPEAEGGEGDRLELFRDGGGFLSVPEHQGFREAFDLYQDFVFHFIQGCENLLSREFWALTLDTLGGGMPAGPL
jgi:hypothetical protein